jgi:hypothetical protein
VKTFNKGYFVVVQDKPVEESVVADVTEPLDVIVGKIRECQQRARRIMPRLPGTVKGAERRTKQKAIRDLI